MTAPNPVAVMAEFGKSMLVFVAPRPWTSMESITNGSVADRP